MKSALAALALITTASLAACGGDDSTSDGGPKAPAQVSAVVKLVQTPPYFVLRQGDGSKCTSRSRETADPIEVTLRDAAGAIVGAETLPYEGGLFIDGTCTWAVGFSVPESDFYEARLEVSGRELETKVGQRDDDRVVIQIDL